MMERPDLKQALGRLLGPAGPEVDCDECFEQLDRYVELELGGEGSPPNAAQPDPSRSSAAPATGNASVALWRKGDTLALSDERCGFA